MTTTLLPSRTTPSCEHRTRRLDDESAMTRLVSSQGPHHSVLLSQETHHSLDLERYPFVEGDSPGLDQGYECDDPLETNPPTVTSDNRVIPSLKPTRLLFSGEPVWFVGVYLTGPSGTVKDFFDLPQLFTSSLAGRHLGRLPLPATARMA